jgi:hypothetical protein
MSFSILVSELLQSGLTEAELARLCAERGASTSQANINRLKRGGQRPFGDLALVLVQLHGERCGTASVAPGGAQ